MYTQQSSRADGANGEPFTFDPTLACVLPKAGGS